MNVSLPQAAKILALSEDEVMFLHQQNTLQAMVNQDTMAWEFNIDEVLQYKYQQEQFAEDEESQRG